MTAQEIAAQLAHEAATVERIAMVARVSRKRQERSRTLERRAQRFAKYAAQGRA